MSKKHQVKEVPMRNAEKADKDSDEAREVRRQATIAESRNMKFTDRVAESTLCLGNEPIPFGEALFPEHWNMRYADLYYPNAKGGGIYIDIPAAYELEDCERKFQAYRKKGVRYVYVAPGESEVEVRAKLDPDWKRPEEETAAQREERVNKQSQMEVTL